MRRLKVVIAGSAFPTLTATMLAPMADGCGNPAPAPPHASADASSGASMAALPEASSDEQEASGTIVLVDGPAAPPPSICGVGYCSTLVPLPPPGTPADPGQLCAASTAPVSSNDAARVTLKAATSTTAMGFVALPASIANRELGPPEITVVSATSSELGKMSVSSVYRLNSGGFTFMATWPSPLPTTGVGQSMTVKASFLISCDDGGTQSVESLTQIFLCFDGTSLGWASSGDACTVCCQVIAEMAPSPIVSDNRGDHLPLGRALRLRVVEIARAGNKVLLFAENDGGAGAEYEWRVSGGTFERLAEDLILWSLPQGDLAPFGQVAVWNDAGAAVENFAWAQAGAAA